MRIAVIGLRGIPNVQGGVESHCEQLFPRIAKLGTEVILFARQSFVGVSKEYQYRNCRIVPIWHPKGSSLEAPIHTICAIFTCIKYKPDLIHIHAIGPGLFAPLARLLGYKVVVTHHGMDYRRQKWGFVAKTVLRLGEWASAKFANAVISISNEISENIRTISPNQTIAQIPNGVELPQKLDVFPQSYLSLNLVGKPYIFALGRFVPEKGFDRLIDSWSKLPKGFCNLVIAGGADHETEYSRRLKQLAQESGVVLTGFVRGDLLQSLFQNAALFVIPSSHEGLPIVLLEAMSHNLPILASDIQPHIEMQLHKECYFPLDSESELANKMYSTLNKPHLHDFREILETKYNWDRIAEKTTDLYKSVLSRQ